jgi:hypothetical protein
MKPIDPDKTEIALGNNPIDIRTTWHSLTNDPELELRLAKEYWLKTIQPYIVGRKLHGVEFYIAADAYRWLRMMTELGISWNESEQGKQSPISEKTFPEWEKDEFHQPEELFVDETFKPEVLATIAASFVKTGRKKLTAAEAVRNAHDLYVTAERYIGTLPKQKQGTGSLTEVLELEFCKVTFMEILQSNEKQSGRLPLLPPVQQKRNEGRLTMNALKIAVRHFLQEQNSSKKKEQYESDEQRWQELVKKSKEDKTAGKHSGTPFRLGNEKILTYQEWQKQNQDFINDCLKNEKISFRLIAVLRYCRFKKFLWKQRSGVLKRELPNRKKATQ